MSGAHPEFAIGQAIRAGCLSQIAFPGNARRGRRAAADTAVETMQTGGWDGIDSRSGGQLAHDHVREGTPDPVELRISREVLKTKHRDPVKSRRRCRAGTGETTKKESRARRLTEHAAPRSAIPGIRAS